MALGADGDQLAERGDSREPFLIARHALVADALDRRQPHVVHAAEVVEDQRLVEVTGSGDGPGAGADDTLLADGLQRRLDDAGPGLSSGSRASHGGHSRRTYTVDVMSGVRAPRMLAHAIARR